MLDYVSKTFIIKSMECNKEWKSNQAHMAEHFTLSTREALRTDLVVYNISLGNKNSRDR
jgi:hypothetical protein